MAQHDLFDFMQDASNRIQSEYARVHKRSNDDPGTAGDEGEENWKTLLLSWLPPTYQVTTKGRIMSHSGKLSPQVDVVVLRPTYPRRLLETKMYLAAGVVAAFECKLTLRGEDVNSTIETAAEIKNLLPARTGSPYAELHSPPIFGLLAHSHNWATKERAADAIHEKLVKEDLQAVAHPRNMIDIVCVADVGTWAAAKMIFDAAWRANPGWEQHHAVTSYMRHAGSIGMPGAFTPVGVLIAQLLRRMAWEDKGLRPLASYFRGVQLEGNALGTNARFWPREIYSDSLRQALEERPLSRDQWSKWSQLFG